MDYLVQAEITTNPGSIQDNLEAVKASILAKTKEYESIVVTEDSIADGKQFLADIRKEKSALDQQRKDIKKAWMRPYEDFEKRVKPIIELYDKPIAVISGQLDEFEQRRKKEKREEIESIYDFVKGDLGDWLPLESIYNTRWENKTCKGKDIREEMESLFDQMKLSIATVKQMESEFEDQGLTVLKATRSLQEALAEINAQEKKKREMEAYHQRQKELEEQKRQEEERLAREAEEAKALAAQEAAAMQENPPAPMAQEQAFGEDVPFEFDETFSFSGESETEALSSEDVPFASAKNYIVTAVVNENQLEDVKMFLDSLGVEYEIK